jgi:hypothetical protein
MKTLATIAMLFLGALIVALCAAAGKPSPPIDPENKL